MGQIFCCHSHRSECAKLKHSQFQSESTFDDSDEYIGSTTQEPASAGPGNQSCDIASPSMTKETRRHHVSSYAGVSAYMGLTPIIEETDNAVVPKPPPNRREPVTNRFLNNGSMKNYQRFVTTH